MNHAKCKKKGLDWKLAALSAILSDIESISDEDRPELLAVIKVKSICDFCKKLRITTILREKCTVQGIEKELPPKRICEECKDERDEFIAHRLNDGVDYYADLYGELES